MLKRLILLNILNVVDCIETYIAIHIRGLKEHNPLFYDLVHNDFVAAATFKIVLLGCVSILLYRSRGRETKFNYLCVNITLLLYILLTIGNTYTLLR